MMSRRQTLRPHCNDAPIPGHRLRTLWAKRCILLPLPQMEYHKNTPYSVGSGVTTRYSMLKVIHTSRLRTWNATWRFD